MYHGFDPCLWSIAATVVNPLSSQHTYVEGLESCYRYQGAFGELACRNSAYLAARAMAKARRALRPCLGFSAMRTCMAECYLPWPYATRPEAQTLNLAGIPDL